MTGACVQYRYVCIISIFHLRWTFPVYRMTPAGPNSPISHNAAFCNRNVHTCAHFCHKMLHCGIFVCYIVGFVKWVSSVRWPNSVTHKTELWRHSVSSRQRRTRRLSFLKIFTSKWLILDTTKVIIIISLRKHRPHRCSDFHYKDIDLRKSRNLNFITGISMLVISCFHLPASCL